VEIQKHILLPQCSATITLPCRKLDHRSCVVKLTCMSKLLGNDGVPLSKTDVEAIILRTNNF
jgi:hypothetical protein